MMLARLLEIAKHAAFASEILGNFENVDTIILIDTSDTGLLLCAGKTVRNKSKRLGRLEDSDFLFGLDFLRRGDADLIVGGFG